MFTKQPSMHVQVSEESLKLKVRFLSLASNINGLLLASSLLTVINIAITCLTFSCNSLKISYMLIR